MKKIYLLFCLLTSSFLLFAQAPQGIPYQAIARNAGGVAISNTAVKVRFSIRDSIATGQIKYQETHNPTASALGLFSVNVGLGTVVSGTFSGINWGKNSKFLQVEMDPAGGTTFTDLGTTQMMSVPYALQASSANNWTPTSSAYGQVNLFNCDGQFQFSPCLPKVTTTTAGAITTVTASCGGQVIFDGGATVIAKGVCWSTSPNPTVALSTKTSDGTGNGTFNSAITGLTPVTTYYVRAFATNSAGTSYGVQISFTTAAVVLASVSTSSIGSLLPVSASGGGVVTSDGGGAVTARGICWSTNQNPTIALSTKTSNGTGTGTFSSSLSTLTPGTLYYVRAYASNSAGTSYGAQQSFTTPVYALATISTSAAASITINSAVSGGNISNDGFAAVTARGICWSTSQNPTIALSTKTSNGSGIGSFTSSLTGLTPGTTYYIRSYATNSVGTAYGAQVNFTTIPLSLPTLTTIAPSAITTLSAISGGNISNDGFASVTARGVCWSTSQNPSIALTTKTSNGSGIGSFISSLSGLTPGTTYYIRAYATNSVGTGYGNQISFVTVGSSISDIDGNTYPTVTIGNQVWMKENLKVSKYKNGNAITTGLSNSNWIASTSGAYSVYNDVSANNNTYGKLYNWYAVTDSRGLCPTGWHSPNNHEWNVLAINVDAAADTNFCHNGICTNPADAKMKSTGTIQSGNGLWSIGNSDATNSSGFTGIPGGSRDFDGTYIGQGEFGAWWSTDSYSASAPRWGYSLPYDQCRNSTRLDFVGPTATNSYGFSVRCIKD
jgi:uncharacterized protein (TIGR02145 family)